ncbi:cytochrome P450 [Nonomuraea longicatena]|uniref:Cytochrome P450 n=1 Tax=Nonomuraea longicatena TaxID=83682 RepID=A0ABN1Q943_9ACTN
MTGAPYAGADPFANPPRGLSEPHPAPAALRAAGPIVRADAYGGGPVWIVTDDALARKVLTDPRLVKDPAYAPPSWDPHIVGLEPPAAEHLSLTTVDGPEHTRLRRAHAGLFSARRMREHADRTTEIVRRLLAEVADDQVDLMADFTTRVPLTVLFDLLGIPLDRVDQAIDACQRMVHGAPDEIGGSIAALEELAAESLRDGRHGLAAELRDHVPDEVTDVQLRYLIFGLIFAGQLTTEAAIGFLVAHLLDPDRPVDGVTIDDLVQETLRLHPPAPFTLWRFATTDLELAGVAIPAGSPVLVDIQGINTAPGRAKGQDLTFGAGPHYCLGAHLAQVELSAIARVLRADFPDARLAVPYRELRQAGEVGIIGGRLTALPVTLRPGSSGAQGG